MIISVFYGLTYGFLRDLLSKLLKNRTNRGSGPVSGPGPARSGPGPQDFSPVRSGTPGTLVLIIDTEDQPITCTHNLLICIINLIVF